METSLLGRPTFGGLATGLDTNALLEGLLALERIPLTRIESRRAEIDSQRGLMRELNTKLLALRSASQEIDNRNSRDSGNALEEEFLRYSGSTTNDEVVTVAAGFGASPSEIEVLVDKLATGSRNFSTSSASDGTTALAENQTIEISLPNADLDAVPPVEATVINVQAGSGGLSNQTVTTGDVSFQEPEEGDLASNSEFRLYGSDAPLERESNIVDDVLTGITLRLRAQSEVRDDFDATNPAHLERNFRTSETVSVDVDVDEVAQGLGKFTSAYNDVVDFIDQQFSYNENTKSSGPLAGDSTLRQVQRELRTIVSRAYAFSTNEGNPFAPSGAGQLGGSISNIGIELIDGGRLRVNKEKLEESLALDANSVRDFLSGRSRNSADDDDPLDFYDEGFAQLTSTTLERLVRSGDGALASREEAFSRRLAEFDVSIERFEFRIGRREETLVARFASLERIVSGLQSQQGFLSGLG